MRIIFRTDASLKIGSGHVMRCLTLADELRQRGAEVMFVCREFPGNLIEMLKGKGYSVVSLQQPVAEYVEVPDNFVHATWLGVPWQEDATETIKALGKSKPEWLIADHYALDQRWEQELRSHADRIMVIDDLADRLHDCDLLLDQNLYPGMETRYDTLVPESCQKLLGPRYALLRPEFAAARKSLRQRDGLIRRVLVFFGGVDPTNETEKALHALASISNSQFRVDVVVGSGNPHNDLIRHFCAVQDGFTYYYQVDNMAELMAAADLAIGAGGSSTWERCALGLPGLLVSIAENQSELAAHGAEQGLFFLMGSSQSVSPEIIAEVVRTFLLSPQNLQAYSLRCLETVDVKGLHRVATAIMPSKIAMRQALPEDCDVMLEWRNAEKTRKYIFDPEPIPLDVHRLWFHKSLCNPDRIILIGEIDSDRSVS